jgi:hypothetical protein
MTEHPFKFPACLKIEKLCTCKEISKIRTTIVYHLRSLNACVHWFLKIPGMHQSMQRGSIALAA